MLRIHQHTCAKACEQYYAAADYYADGSESLGVWGGKGAERLGLVGDVRKADFKALCYNRDPQSGERLTVRTSSKRTVAYDFNFHVPKSVSIANALRDDPRVAEAFREAVAETMAELEPEAKTRVRKHGRDDGDRATGNLVYATFVHSTTRPVGGLPDPHLHAHVVVFNATFDEAEGRWKAAQFRDLKRDARYYEAAFHARLAGKLAEHGYDIRRTAKGWELEGVPASAIGKFSRRTAEIEAEAAALGVSDPAQKSELGAKTRKRKAKNLSPAELRSEWTSMLTPNEAEAIAELKSDDANASFDSKAEAKHAFDYALKHVFERQAVVPEKRLLEEALRFGVGRLAVEDVKAELERDGLIRGELDGRAMVTTSEVLAEEKYVTQFARDGRGTMKPLAPEPARHAGDKLSDEQRKAVNALLNSHDRVQCLVGRAGVGKTTLLRDAVGHIERNGHRVLALAPSADASRGVLRSEGFADADTVAKFLADPQLKEKARGNVLLVDEAGLLGNQDLARLFSTAKSLNSRVILVGDPAQHGSVSRGSPLTLLEKHAGLKPICVGEIRRQRHQGYREAVKLLSEGNTLGGFDKLNQLGWVKEVSDDERGTAIAAEYVAATSAGKSCLVVSPTHAEGAACTASIRANLQANGRLGEGREFTQLAPIHLTEAERSDAVHYRKGDVIEFRQNAKGFKRGERWNVIAADDTNVIVEQGNRQAELPLHHANRFSIFRPEVKAFAVGDRIRITQNGKAIEGKLLSNGSLHTIAGFTKRGDVLLEDGGTVSQGFGHWTYGYCTTSHASQGKTVDRVILAQSTTSLPASSMEQFYVSASRGREGLTIFTDDATALRAAIERPEQRLTATDFAQTTMQQKPTLRRAAFHLQRFATLAKSRMQRAMQPVVERFRLPADRERGMEYGI